MRGKHWTSLFRLAGSNAPRSATRASSPPAKEAWVYLLAAFESFATAFRLTTAEPAVCLRRSLRDEPKEPEHDALGDRHEAIAVLPDPKDGDLGARAVSR